MSKVEVTYYVRAGARVGPCVHRARYTDRGAWFASRGDTRTAYADTLQSAVDKVWPNGEILLKGEDGQVLGARVGGVWFGRWGKGTDPLKDVYPMLDGTFGVWCVAHRAHSRVSFDRSPHAGDPLEACRAYLAAEASEPAPEVTRFEIVDADEWHAADTVPQVRWRRSWGWCACMPTAQCSYSRNTLAAAVDAVHPSGDVDVYDGEILVALRVDGTWFERHGIEGLSALGCEYQVANLAPWQAGDLSVGLETQGATAHEACRNWLNQVEYTARNAAPPFTKHDQAKPRTDLLPPRALLAMAAVLAHGAEKYGDDNWRRGGVGARPRYIAAALRHVLAYQSGEELDPESGLGHLAHALTSLAFAFELGEVGTVDPSK